MRIVNVINIKFVLQGLMFLLAVIVVFLRSPSTYIHPQFWAEDGRVFFETAYRYHFSLGTLMLPYAGYFQFLPRSISLLGSFISLQYMPTVFSFIAVTIQTLPVIYLWSPRFSKIVKSTTAKVFLTFFYLFLPFTQEISGNLTNSQWYLALVALMLILISESNNIWIKWVDRLLLLFAGLSGPFAILLMPVALLGWLSNRKGYTLKRLYIVLACSTIDIINLLFFEARGSGYLGITLTRFFNIVGGQVFGTAIFGADSLHLLFSRPWVTPLLTILGVGLMTYVFIKCSIELKLFIIYSFLILFAAMFFPTSSSSPKGLWYILQEEGATARYFFLVHLAVFVSLVWLLYSRRYIFLKVASVVIIILALMFGIPNDFRYSQIPNLHFADYANKFQSLPKGQKERIPINPGPSWDITLIKR